MPSEPTDLFSLIFKVVNKLRLFQLYNEMAVKEFVSREVVQMRLMDCWNVFIV